MPKQTKNPVQCVNCGNKHDYSQRKNVSPTEVNEPEERAGIKILSISVCPKCKKQSYECLEIHKG